MSDELRGSIVEGITDPPTIAGEFRELVRWANRAELEEAQRRLRSDRRRLEGALAAIDGQLDQMVTESPALKSVGWRRETEL